MPAQKSQSKLLQKLGAKLKTAHEKHKADETEYGQGGELPAGIEGGIAQLVEAKFDQYKNGDMKGEYYFMAAGVCKSPKDFAGQRVEGLRTQIGPEPLCDTPNRQTKKTLEDHLAWVYNELRKLGVDTSSMNFEDLEATVAMLKDAKPHFKFRTWKGKKEVSGPYANQEPRTNHVWAGVCDYSEEDNVAPEAEDATAEGAATSPDDFPDETPAGEETAQQEEDLDELAEQADSGDEEAKDRLTTLAVEQGCTEDQVAEASDWRAVAGMIRNPAGTTAEEEEEPVEAAPKKGDVFSYQPIDPKTKKPMVDVKTKKPVKAFEVEVITVDSKTKKATVKSLNDKKVYKDVPFDQLKEV